MSEIASAFSAHAGDYDRLRRALVPCFNDFYGSAVEIAVRGGLSQPCRVLDLGAGTGLLSAMLVERLPQAHVHLVDLADGMLNQARRRLAGRSASFAVADYATAPLGGPWQLVVSALSIHHLEDADKRALFRRIHEALVPGGLFINAEQVLAPTSALQARDDALWREQAASLGAEPEEIAAAQERMRYDRCATLEAQLAWLREAGFNDVDCAFKQWRFAVYSATRPAAA